MGFALQNYDAIGRWRTEEANRPIDASGKLITGQRFANWTELRELLARERREEFAECFVKQLLTYALGRGVTYRDKTAIRQILTRAEVTEYGFQDLILAVCESAPFQRMHIER